MRPLILGFMVAVLTIAANGAIAQTLSGTAFTVARHLLVTNQHVVAGCSSIEVVSADGRRTASIVDANDQIDLALLRVTEIKGPTARLRNPRNVRLGEPVMVFGYPLVGSLSSGGNFTSGLVSGLRGLRDAAGEIQITAPVQPGNSGGPLLDGSGLVIGVVEAKLDALRLARITGDIPQNVNFAVSLEVLADFLAKNNVAFRNGAVSKPLDTARVAEIAQTFTHRVECWRRSQQAKASPQVKERKAPSEVGEREAPPETQGPATTVDMTTRKGMIIAYLAEHYQGCRGTVTYENTRGGREVYVIDCPPRDAYVWCQFFGESVTANMLAEGNHRYLVPNHEGKKVPACYYAGKATRPSR